MPFGTYVGSSKEDLKSARENLDSTLLSRAAKEIGVSENELVARDMDPKKDLEQSNPEFLWSTLSADTDNSIIEGITVDDNKFIGFYGIAINTASPNEKRLTFKSGAKTLDIVQLEGIQALEEPVAVFDVPTIITQNSSLTVDLWTTNDNDSKLVLLGRTVEKEGKNIAPRSSD